MRVLVCGGRNFNDSDLIDGVLDAVHAKTPIKVIIHGNAKGADYWARMWAVHHDPKVLEAPFRPDWHTHGAAAGPLRNQRMIDEGKPDLVIAFPGGRGTADMVRRARGAGIKVRPIPHRGDPRGDPRGVDL